MKNRVRSFIRNKHCLYVTTKKLKRFSKKLRRSIRGKNNSILNKGILHNVHYNIVGNNNLISIGDGSELTDLEIYIRGNNHVLKISANCKLKSGSIWFEDNDCQILIGEGTTIESAHLAVTEPKRKIVIGKDCMFSREIEFRTGDSHSIIDSETKRRINPALDIEVGDHVWIGSRSIILKGAKIGNNCVIGTNSIVTSNVFSNTIAAGIPAKEIRGGIDWVRERIYT